MLVIINEKEIEMTIDEVKEYAKEHNLKFLVTKSVSGKLVKISSEHIEDFISKQEKSIKKFNTKKEIPAQVKKKSTNEKQNKTQSLNLIIPKNILNLIENADLSVWEKLFVANAYNIEPVYIEKVLKYPIKKKEGRNEFEIKKEDVKRDIEASLKNLVEFCQNEKNFTINPIETENGKQTPISRELDAQIEALKARGEWSENLSKTPREQLLSNLAKEQTKRLYAHLKHNVDYILGLNFEPAFMFLMLNENLTMVYRTNEKGRIIEIRNLNQTIHDFMNFNDMVLSKLYNEINFEKNKSFAEIYFKSCENFANTTAEKAIVNLEGVNTFGKGQWLKFEGKTSNEKEYLKNAENLSALVQGTPWCTKTMASTQLAEGDFFVFVDNEKKPHIAVKLSGNSVDEVRGIINGNRQELEEDYRDVAIDFLNNNKQLEDSQNWLEQEEWNKKLIYYKEKIKNGNFLESDVENCLNILQKNDFKSHGGKNSNQEELKELLPNVKEKIAIFFGVETKNVFFNKNINLSALKKPCVVINGIVKVDKDYSNILNLKSGIIDNFNINLAECIVKMKDVDAIKNDGELTALIWASEFGHTEIVQRLIEKKANVNAKDYDGISPLFYAVLSNSPEIIKTLIENRADINAKSHNRTALIWASEFGRTEIARLLIEKGANVNTKGNDNMTALIYAEKYGHTEIARLLIEKGADVNAKDKYEKNALIHAKEKGQKEIVELLKNHMKQPIEKEL